VDPTDKAAVSNAVGSQNLLQVYSVYEKLKNAPKPAGSASASASASSSDGAASASASAASPPSDAQKKQAEALKSRGNAAMASKDYSTAIDLYSQALALHPGNAIYLSNRAAAYSAAKDHESARADAEAAVAVDPTYTKGWSRLGLARFALGDAKGSMEAYKKGIDYEGSGGSDAMKKGYETAKRRVDELGAEDLDDEMGNARDAGAGAGAGGMPDLASLAGMFGGGGAGGAGRGGGAGGMPDLSSIMSNPMFASMAQKLMSNPDMMNNLMSNPRLREMAESFGGGGGGAGGAGRGGGGGGGGGMPDFSALMNDPSIAEMARNMMGGGAGRGGPGGGPGGR
jgi:small glutamine-rich tetratricopeptide repeat-containing protein alpha